MQRSVFYSKIHRAVVTQADLHYEGSITIDSALMEAADILENEQVHVWNISRGTRIITYALRGDEGSGVICINGAAAHGNEPGDLVIIATFADMSREEADRHVPRVIRVDEKTRLLGDVAEVPGPKRALAE